jgi:hypothetical protein
MGENEKKDVILDENLTKALNNLDDFMKSHKVAMGTEEKKEHEKEKKDEKLEKCSCSKEGCKGECKKSMEQAVVVEEVKTPVAAVEEKKPLETEKSFVEEAKKVDIISKAFDASDFLGELVTLVGTSIDSFKAEIRDTMSKSFESVGKSADQVNKSMEYQNESDSAILTVLKEISKSMSAQSERLTTLEKTPELKKSITATPVDREFHKSEDGAVKISKKEISDKLMNMCLSKSMVGNRVVSQEELAIFESTGQIKDLRPELQKAILA